ncbi:MAG: hypothetical protein JNK82_36425 [Myxococcaceae bacterium]|nr:hypothetical protein [Myxococcaceae bacterium]
MRASLLTLVLLSGCTQSVLADRAFTLSCHSASTATTRGMHCIRTDTRTGEVHRVDLSKLTTSNGPTAAAAGPAGRYQTACATAASADQADFYCIRLNTETGELLAINLQKLGSVP